MRPNNIAAILLLIAAAWKAGLLDGLPVVGPAEGPREVLIVRESADATPAEAMALTALRAGEPAKYLKEKGHSLTVLDKDAVGPDGQPSPAVTKHQPYGSLPELLIVAPPGKVLWRGPLPATSAGVLEVLKGHGG